MLGVGWDHPDEAATTWAKVRGNRFAKAGLEMACWDLFTRVQRYAVGRGTRRDAPRDPLGVSLGIEPTVAGIVEQVEHYLDQGYKRIKMKIAPGKDLAYLRAVRDRWPDVLLMADANSAYSLDNPSMSPHCERWMD